MGYVPSWPLSASVRADCCGQVVRHATGMLLECCTSVCVTHIIGSQGVPGVTKREQEIGMSMHATLDGALSATA